MRLFTKILFGLMTFSAIASCKKENSFSASANSQSDEIRSAPPGGNYWIRRQDFPNAVRGASSFVINGKGYVYGGIIFGYPINDLWEFDPTLNSWTKKASPPFARPRSSAASFVIDGKGYIVGGYIDDPGENNMSRDTWEYNPVTNTWRQRRNLPEARFGATGFAIYRKGYVAMGTTPSRSLRADVLEYDADLNSWSTKAILASEFGRNHAVSFVINNKAYIGTGTNGFENHKDLLEFDPQTNSWIRKADYPGGTRYGAIAFTIGSLGYVGSGIQIGYPSTYNEFWSYNRSSNSWTRKANVPGGERVSAVGFSIGSYGYVGAGATESSIPDPRGFYRYSISTVSSTQTQ
jgi:N-acetylneuraminic acid mutarotase